MYSDLKQQLLNTQKFIKVYFCSIFNSRLFFDLFKRFFDIIISLIAIVLTLPLMLCIAILIKLDSKGKIIYKHKRVGLHGKEFYVYKFRSMISTEKPLDELLTPTQMNQFKHNYKIYNDPRITRIGRFLRNSSLDELPQFFNILLGQMSFIGSRPISQEETELYGNDRALLLSVVPGLTGYWQTNSHRCTTYKDRIKMELFYIKNKNIIFDIKIILSTIVVVFLWKGTK